MKREFSINVLILLVANVLVKPLYIFGVDRTVQNVVGPEEYGLFFALFNFTYLFYIINDLGLQVFTNRFISQHRNLVGRYLPNILGIKLFAAVIYGICIVIFGWMIGYFPTYWKLLLMVGLNQILVALLFYLRANLSGLGYYREDSIISVLDRLILILLMGYLLLSPKFTGQFQITWFVLGHTFSLVLTILFILVFLLPKVKLIGIQFNFKSWRSIIKASAPYALVIVLMTFYSRLDAVMIQRLLPDGNYESGVYASAFRLLDAFNMLGFLVAGLVVPMFARMEKEGEDLGPFFRQALLLLISISGSITLGALFFRFEIMDLLYHEATPYYGSLLTFLLPTFIVTSAGYIINSYLTATGAIKQLNRYLLIGVIANFLLNWLLIPEYKAQGATIATFLTQLLMALMMLFFAQKRLGLGANWVALTRVAVFVLGSLLIGWICSEFLGWIWEIKLVFSILGATILAFITKVIDPELITSLLDSRKS